MMIELSAPAKVNLSLHITGRRTDGYHELSTRMQKLDLCDRLQLELTDTGTIEIVCGGEDVPADASNLAVRAAARFFQKYGNEQSYGLRIKLTKRIPVAAGLGGGSSDGAAVLKGLNRLFEHPLTEVELLEIGRQLGVDVAFFVSGHSSVWATGIGDQLEQARSVDNYHYLLVNPGISVATRWVYENYRLTKENNKFSICGSQNSKDIEFSAEGLHNDLEQVTLPRYPVIGELKALLLEQGASGALMSGSGPTVFALFADRNRIETAFAAVTKRFSKQKGYRIFIAQAYHGV